MGFLPRFEDLARPNEIAAPRRMLTAALHLPRYVRLCWRLLRDGRVPFVRKFMCLFAIVYLLSPIDFVPELFLPLIGGFDDLGLLAYAFHSLVAESPREVVEEHIASIRGRRNPNAST